MFDGKIEAWAESGHQQATPQDAFGEPLTAMSTSRSQHFANCSNCMFPCRQLLGLSSPKQLKNGPEAAGRVSKRSRILASSQIPVETSHKDPCPRGYENPSSLDNKVNVQASVNGFTEFPSSTAYRSVSEHPTTTMTYLPCVVEAHPKYLDNGANVAPASLMESANARKHVVNAEARPSVCVFGDGFGPYGPGNQGMAFQTQFVSKN